MPTTCGFPNCRFRSRYRGAEDNRHFYRVPKKPAVLRKRWLDAIGRTEETIVSQLRVCSGHFHGGEKHEGDIPVADPSVDPLVRIELPPKPARILSTSAGPRSGFTLRGGRSRGCGSTLKTKPNILRSGMMSFFNRNGTYNALNTNTTKFANSHPSNCQYGSSTTEHRPYNKWLLNPFALPFEEQASLSDVPKSQHDIGDNPVAPGNFISTAQGNEKRSFIKSQSITPGFNAYNYDNLISPERPAQGMRPHFPFTPLLPLSHGLANISARPHMAGISFKSSVKSSSFEGLSPVTDSSHKAYLTQHPAGGSQPATSLAALKFSQWITSLQGMFGSKNTDGHFNMQLFTNMFLKMLEKHAPITGPCEAMQSEAYPFNFQETPKVCEISSNEAAAAANIGGRQSNGKLMSPTSEHSKFGQSKMHQNSFGGWPSLGGSSFPAMQVHPINLTNPIHQIRQSIHDDIFIENTLVCDQYDKTAKARAEANSSDNQVASDIVRRPIKPPCTGPGSKIDQEESSLVLSESSNSAASQQNGGAQKPIVVFRGISDGSNELTVLEDIAEVIIMSTHVESERLERIYRKATDLVIHSDSKPSRDQWSRFVNLRSVWLITEERCPSICDNPVQGVKFNTIPRELFNVELLCEFIVSLLLVTTNRVVQFGRPRHVSLKRPFSVPLEFGESRWRSSNTPHNRRDLLKRNMVIPNSGIVDDNNWDELPLVMLPSKRCYGQSVREMKIGIIAQDTLIKNLVISLCAFDCTIFVHQSNWTEDIGQLDHTRRFVNMEEMVAEVDWLVVLAGHKCVTDEVGTFVNDNSGAIQLITDSLLLKVKQGASLLCLSGNQTFPFGMHALRNALLSGQLKTVLLGVGGGEKGSLESFTHPNWIYLPDYAARILLNAKEYCVLVARIIRQSLLKRKQCFIEANLGMKSLPPYSNSSLFENHPFVQSIYANDSILSHGPKPSELPHSPKMVQEENVTAQRKFGTDSPISVKKSNFCITALVTSTTPVDYSRTCTKQSVLRFGGIKEHETIL